MKPEQHPYMPPVILSGPRRKSWTKRSAEIVLMLVFIGLAAFAWYLAVLGLRHEYHEVIPRCDFGDDERAPRIKHFVPQQDECTHWQSCPQKFDAPHGN